MIAWRNLMRNKVYSFINIAGLSIGLASAMLIILFTKDEVSFDKFHKHGDRIFRIVSDRYNEQGIKEGGGGFTGHFHGPAFAKEIPEIEEVVRYELYYTDVKKETELLRQSGIKVDANFFKVFDFPLLYGDPATALSQPNYVVLDEDAATKYFGTKDAVGKTLMVKEEESYKPLTVSAIAKRVPQNSSFRFEMLLPLNVAEDVLQYKMNWFNFFLNTFVVIAPNTDIELVNRKMQDFYERDAKDVILQMNKEFNVKSSSVYKLQPLADLHLNVEYGSGNGLVQGSNPWYSYILSGIALFILLIACINFVNLTIARSLKRSKEIGIRKVIGSSRKELIFQFLGESFLFTLIAFLLAFLWVKLSLPTFNSLANKELSFAYLFDIRLVTAYVILLLITALSAGFYPALVLSSFDPVKTLYNRIQVGGKSYLQRGLVVLQFTLATLLVAGTIAIYKQFNFMIDKPLGYNDMGLIDIEKEGMTNDQFKRFEQELLQQDYILGVAPRNSGQWSTGAKVNGTQNIHYAVETVNENYLDVMQIKLLYGRNFESSRSSDSIESVIVNESFVKAAQWKEPIGEEVNLFWDNNRKFRVIGVVADHHYASLLEEIGPQLLKLGKNQEFGMAVIRIKPGSDFKALQHISNTFKKLFPLDYYSYAFRIDANRESYEAEDKWKQMLLFGGLLTIFISSIGLFGLSVLNAEKRTKEVGIRKVLGASSISIAGLLSKEFLQLVFLAILIATPIAWYAIHKWLQNYPYRIFIDFSIFLLAGSGAILIALLTISHHAYITAKSNPVKSLKTE
jgi:putative ABC transport system permease protein